MQRRYDLGLEIKILSNLVRRKVFEVAPPPESGEFSEIRGQVLEFLHENQDRDIFQRELEEVFCVRRSTASRLLSDMEGKGLVVRRPVAWDARLKKITLTQKAIAIHQEIRKRIDFLEDSMTKNLTESEIEQFIATARKIKQNLL